MERSILGKPASWQGGMVPMVAAVLIGLVSGAFAFSPTGTVSFAPGAKLRATSPAILQHRPLPISRRMAPVAARGLQLRMKDKQAGGAGLAFKAPDNTELIYDFTPAGSPTIVYLHGLNQTRLESKANALQGWCKRNNHGFFAADCYGCGQSGGLYKDGTITRWVDDTIKMIKEVVKGPVILVGSGIGGWVSLVVATKMPEEVKGVVGIAADPDFTTDVVLPELTAEVKEQIKQSGLADIMWGKSQYTISQELLDDANNHMMLKGGMKSIPITCPVRLLQGLGDEEIPPQRALELCDCLQTDDVVVTYVKFGDHFLDDSEDVDLMHTCVQEIADKFFEFDLRSPTSG